MQFRFDFGARAWFANHLNFGDMMHVLVTIFEQLVPISGGGTPRISSVIDAFIKKEHQVSVAASFGVGRETALKVLKCDRLFPLKNVDRLDENKISKYLFFHPFNVLRVVYEATKVKPDLLIAHNSIAGLANLLAKKITGCRAVLDMTDLIFEYLSSYHRSISWVNSFQRIGRQIENKVIQETDRIITISNSMKDLLVQRGANGENVDVVYDGVKLDIFKPCDETAAILRQKYANGAENVIMHHGVIDPQDQPEIIVDAATYVLEEYPKSMFWMIGDGVAVPSIKVLTKERGIDKNFFFSGWLPFEDVPGFISACDVGSVILPDTISAKTRVTLKGFEYWACEKPIVVPSCRL